MLLREKIHSLGMTKWEFSKMFLWFLMLNTAYLGLVILWLYGLYQIKDDFSDWLLHGILMAILYVIASVALKPIWVVAIDIWNTKK